MIRINKRAECPERLSNKGGEETKQNCDAYEAAPDAFHSKPGRKTNEIRKFSFDGGIYGHETVKKALIEDQNGKCCYCEADFLANGYGDVEHFRPKSAYVKKEETSLSYPGYYWLAYDWKNLLLSCQICNQKHKRNYFPLTDEQYRVNNHLSAEKLPNEDPLLLHPAEEDPEAHITFRDEVPVAKNASEKGDLSIRYYGIDRAELCDERARYLELVDAILVFAEIDMNDQGEVRFACNSFGITHAALKKKAQAGKKYFENAAKSHFPYTSMIRANFPHLPCD